MKAKDVFGLILRVVGLVCVSWGGFYLLSCFYILTGFPVQEGLGIKQYLLVGVPYLLVGLYFLRGAPHVLHFAYGPDDPPSKQFNEGTDFPRDDSKAP